MRGVLKVIGGVMIAIGAIWIGQGLGYIGGSFMTGQSHWAWIGAATAVGGVIALAVGRQK